VRRRRWRRRWRWRWWLYLQEPVWRRLLRQRRLLPQPVSRRRHHLLWRRDVRDRRSVLLASLRPRRRRLLFRRDLLSFRRRLRSLDLPSGRCSRVQWWRLLRDGHAVRQRGRLPPERRGRLRRWHLLRGRFCVRPGRLPADRHGGLRRRNVLRLRGGLRDRRLLSVERPHVQSAAGRGDRLWRQYLLPERRARVLCVRNLRCERDRVRSAVLCRTAGLQRRVLRRNRNVLPERLRTAGTKLRRLHPRNHLCIRGDLLLVRGVPAGRLRVRGSAVLPGRHAALLHGRRLRASGRSVLRSGHPRRRLLRA
jgi:hypothetical protein